MAKFKQGESGNPQGRPSGATNKIARPIKTQLSDFVNEKMKELPEIWSKLSPRDKAQFLKDLYPYFVARMQSIQVGVEFDQLNDSQLDYIIETLLNKDEKH